MPAATGMVNASAGLWSQKELEPASNGPQLCAMHLQPELFNTMQQMVNGRMPNQDEVKALVDSVQVHNDRIR